MCAASLITTATDWTAQLEQLIATTRRMPEFIKDATNASLDHQNKLIELKKKLGVEKQMYEAAKLIKARMDKQSSVQQVENSLKESLDRIAFLEGQVEEMEKEMAGIKLDRKESGASEYLDAIETLPVSAKISPSSSQKSSVTTESSRSSADLNWFLSGQKLTWPKIDYKIGELSYRLKLNENILEAEEKIIEAFAAGQNVKAELLEGKEATKKRVQILSQALKKYTSLIIGGDNTSSTSTTTSSDDLQGAETLFTGKLMIKVTKIGGLAGTSTPPFTFNFDLDQLSNFRSGKNNKKSVESVVINGSKDPEDPSSFSCYQEIVINLVRSSEFELTVTSGASQSIKGIFFVKLATLFEAGPDEECAVSHAFEMEPAGSVNLQFHFSNSINLL